MYFRKVFDNTYIWNTPSLKKTRFKCYVLNNATKNWWGLRLLEFLFKRHYYLFTKYISLTFIYVYAHDVHLLSQYINYIYFKQVLFSQISYICILVWFDKIYIYIYIGRHYPVRSHIHYPRHYHICRCHIELVNPLSLALCRFATKIMSNGGPYGPRPDRYDAQRGTPRRSMGSQSRAPECKWTSKSMTCHSPNRSTNTDRSAPAGR